MKDILKVFMIFGSGFFTILLLFVLPDPGGGELMIVIYTIPFFVGLGLILGLVYYFLSKKTYNKVFKDRMFYIMFLLLIFLSFIFFPHA